MKLITSTVKINTIMWHNVLENNSHLNLNVNNHLSSFSNVATTLITTVHSHSHYSELVEIVHRFKTNEILELERLLDNL